MTHEIDGYTKLNGLPVRMRRWGLVAIFLLSSQPIQAGTNEWTASFAPAATACGAFPFWTDQLVTCTLQAIIDSYPTDELNQCARVSYVDPHPPINSGLNVYRRNVGWQILQGGTWINQNGFETPCGVFGGGQGSEWWRGTSCPGGYTYSIAVGGCVPPPPPDVTERDDANGKLCKGNPCDVISGNKRQQEADYRGAGELGFVRIYNSLRYHSAKQGPFGRPLGEGWFGSYLQFLSAASGLASSVVHAVRPDGEVVSLTATAPGSTTTQYSVNGEFKERLVVLTNTSGAFVGWRYVTDSDSSELYDTNGRLVSITSRSGKTQILTYGSNDRVASVIDDFGNELIFQWDTASPARLASITLPGSGSGQVVFTYGVNNNLTQATYPDMSTRQYLYELTGAGQANLLTGIIDEAGVRFATWGYGAGNVVTSSIHAGGVDSYTMTYNANGTRVVVDPLNTSRTYTTAVISGQRRYTGSNLLCQGCGEYDSATFDTLGNFQSTIDFKGIETRFTHDTARTLQTSRTEAFGTPRARTISTSWHPTYRLPALVTEPGRTTGFQYDATGNLLQLDVTDTATSTVRRTVSTYDTYGRVLTVNGPRTDVTDVTTYTHYTCGAGFQCGRVNTVTNALSQVTTYTSYNAHGQPLTVTDANGVNITLAYDARQRLTSRTVGTEQTTLEYWPTGLLKKVTLPDLSTVQYSYDDAHRLTRIDDSAGNYIVYTLDGMGNRTAENTYDPTNFLRRTHSQVFNSLNQLTQTLTASGSLTQATVFGYDGNGNQTTANAPLARNSVNAYDELNRLKTVTDAANGLNQISYDSRDNLTSVIDPRGTVTTYTYNGFDDVATQTSPDTGQTTNTYDSGGNLKTSTNARSAVTTYGYDALGRVTSAAYKIGNKTDQTIAFTYDAGTYGKGRRTGASDANHSMSWIYDALGRVTSKSQTVSTVAKTVGYGYANGNLTSLTTPSGQAVVYGYNSNGQVTSITVNGTTLLSDVVYEPFGPMKGWTWGNGTAMSRTFDTDGKVMAIASAGNKTYTYDDGFRITGITDTVTPVNSYTYGYDGLDRLTSAVKPGTTRGWTYDANGNRLTETGAAPSTYTVSSTNNRVSSISGAVARTYTYDAVGSVLKYSTVTATYNNRGRMKSLKAGNTTANFTHNALGQLVKRTGGTPGTIHYMYDEAGHLLGEYDSSGALIQETIWFGDTPVATLRPGTPVEIFYVHTDHLKTPRKITRPSDNSARWTWESDPFGTALPNENPQSLGNFKYSLRFPGQLYDAHTGLMYNYFRDYDSVTGRYIQSDPIGLAGGINTYGYVGSNPITYVDPYGNVRWGELGSATLGLLGNGAGIVVGGALVGAPTGVSQVVGVAVVAKSLWGWGANWYAFTRALSDDAKFDIPTQFETLPRTTAHMLSCGPTGERVADVLDLSLDFATGRPTAGFLRNPSGFLRSPVGYPPLNSNRFLSPVTVDRLLPSQFNTAAGTLQGAQSTEYVMDAWLP